MAAQQDRRLGRARRAGRQPGQQRPVRQRSVLVAHPSAELYGSDRVLLESVEGMVAEGWRVLATVPGPGALVDELVARGAEVELCPAPVIRKSALRPAGFVRFALDVLRSVRPACSLIARSRADEIYVNTITIPTWLLLGRVMGRRVTCHVHEAEGSASRLVRGLICLPLVLAQQIIVNSRFSLDVLGGAIGFLRGRSTVVYNGVPGPAEPIPARTRLDGPVRLLFLGRLSPRKGPQVALAAVEQLHGTGADVRLDLLGAVFPGYEWFEDELHATVTAAGLDDAVGFLGFDSDVWPHIATADIVVVPSVVDEPFGNTAVEAVLGARPLVVSSTSGLREASAGYASAQQVEPDRSDLLREAVERVIGDWETYREAAAADASVARERHSVQRYQREIVRVLTRAHRG